MGARLPMGQPNSVRRVAWPDGTRSAVAVGCPPGRDSVPALVGIGILGEPGQARPHCRRSRGCCRDDVWVDRTWPERTPPRHWRYQRRCRGSGRGRGRGRGGGGGGWLDHAAVVCKRGCAVATGQSDLLACPITRRPAVPQPRLCVSVYARARACV